jgi:hypothetical protein
MPRWPDGWARPGKCYAPVPVGTPDGNAGLLQDASDWNAIPDDLVIVGMCFATNHGRAQYQAIEHAPAPLETGRGHDPTMAVLAVHGLRGTGKRRIGEAADRDRNSRGLSRRIPEDRGATRSAEVERDRESAI